MIRPLQFFLLLLSIALFSCKKEQEPDPEYFMRATINGMEWQASPAAAQLDYDHDFSAFHTWLRSGSKGPLTDGVEYSLNFMLNNDISKGKFYFNNNGKGEINADGGVSGSVRIEKPTLLPSHSRDHFYANSSTGFIEINHLTRYEIGGTFEFTAIPSEYSGYPASDVYKVEKGTFLVQITGVSGARWEGPK